MTDCARCGDCCERFPLNTPERADIYGRKMLANVGGRAVDSDGVQRKQWAWMGNLTPVDGPWRDSDGTLRWAYTCPLFDPARRTCTDHTNRPEVCRRYPHYGREPKRYPGQDSLSPRCSFNADHRTMLPIVAVS